MLTDAGTTTPPPVVLLPDPGTLFDRRARRLADLAQGHAMGSYLSFLSGLAAAQQRAAAEIGPAQPVAAEIAHRHGMPLLPRDSSGLDGRWRQALAIILVDLAKTALPEPARQVIDRLAAASPSELDAQAVAWLNGHADDLGAALFLAAALQVAWSTAAAALDPATVQKLDPPGLCPVCGSPPVAGMVLAAEPLDGVRYLACGLCGSRWHYPRAHCSACGSDRDIGLLAFETGLGRGETCGECRTYLKLFEAAKAPATEPFADDLATAGLDLRLGEEGWHRAAANPFLLAVPR